MRISSFFVLLFLVLAMGANLIGQTVVEYGTATAASTGGAATDTKKISKSVGRVFDRIGKKLDRVSRGSKATAAPAAKPTAPGKVKQPAAPSAAKHEASPIVNRSQIRIGMSREELLSTVGKPFLEISGTDEGGFAQTYMYHGSAESITVTLHDGKVTGVSPMPEESSTAPALATRE